MTQPHVVPRPREDVSVKKEKKERERQRDGHSRGRGRPDVIQSHSIFEQGPAEMMRKKGGGGWGEDGLWEGIEGMGWDWAMGGVGGQRGQDWGYGGGWGQLRMGAVKDGGS